MRKILIHFPTLFQGFFWYAVSIAAVIFSGTKLIAILKQGKPQDETSLLAFFIWFALAMLVFFVLLRFFKRRWFFESLFALALFSGLWFLLDIFLPSMFSLPLALALVLSREIFRFVYVHNVIVVLGISGIAASLGLSFTPFASIILLLVFSVYDILAVYVTHHMVRMFAGLMREHVIVALVLPEKINQLKTSLDKVQPGAGFFLLGTGDLALPLLFLASVLPLGGAVPAATAIGILAGFLLTHIIFLNQRFRRPMPALPPMVIGTLLGFFVGLLL